MPEDAKRSPKDTASAVELKVYATARLPTRFGEFQIASFVDPAGKRLDDVAVFRGELAGAEELVTRVHSECLTGDALGSLRCDCRDQLELALGRVAARDAGLVVYLRQEGRGIGIAEKVAAYALQDQGMDTVEANVHLGFDADLRDYSHAAAMIRALGVQSIVLQTNNPKKVAGLRQNGIEVSARQAIVAQSRDENAAYLAAKAGKLGHELD